MQTRLHRNGHCQSKRLFKLAIQLYRKTETRRRESRQIETTVVMRRPTEVAKCLQSYDRAEEEILEKQRFSESPVIIPVLATKLHQG